MYFKKTKLFLISASLIFGSSYSTVSVAKEGMFTLDQLPEISNDLRNAGLELKPKQLTSLTDFPMGAIISLGNCSASFVSEKGLVITNHHCARGSIQYNSSEENNYLDDGFLAADLTHELPAAAGSRIYVTKQVNDVTDAVLNGVSASQSGQQRNKVIEKNRKALIAECEKDDGHRCQVSSFFGGLQYKLNKRLEIKDVRLVYAPADSIGKYGGDIDNWLWPRHTGDFAFYRAYVSPNGESTDYSESNVPYTPKHVLSVSSSGLDEGDFVMVAGYPGSTSRYSRLVEVENVFNWNYPTWITVLENWINTIEQASEESSDARIKYESRLAGLNNFKKNLGGQLVGAKRIDLVKRRATREAKLNQWIDSNSDSNDFAKAITALDKLSQETAQAQRKEYWYKNVTRPQLLGAARRLYRLSKEKQKPDAERDSGYQERDISFFKQGMESIERRYDSKVDKAEWLAFIKGYLAQPKNQRVAAFDKALGLKGDVNFNDLSNTLDKYYTDTNLNDLDARLGLINAGTAELEKSEDPFIKLAIAIYNEDIEQEKAKKSRKGRYAKLEPKYMQAIIAWQQSQGLTTYPDANSNLRITYGNVMGGAPKDGLRYTPFTTLEGIVEKDTGKEPFNAPQAQLDLINDNDYGAYKLKSIGSVPVNFMSDLDITGGNSGSATLNSKGELVGLLFDGTIESVNSDWEFDATINRAIHVDSRYILWVMEKLDGATNLIGEMNIVKH